MHETQRGPAGVWLPIYGLLLLQRPFEAYYDEQHDVWLVCGSLHLGMDGGTAMVLLGGSDGKVLAVTHGK